ncbi:SDR family oxidoreductase [Corallococcus carmarthensis]|uniref:SDR family oxidoreductase n=1 Tax=Corallococcus carmarthensis TaxID=2316728 RepID=A0A3A8KD31_9BACT|nr:SDR family oxidoreductase [Corallococcus carmarthensis]NOK17558.1 SDR family oxidoreductase [Corallococcus carmarthensis]RKH00352.1 SDR family oxidoreductase [Corallococcus carmarthensis]
MRAMQGKSVIVTGASAGIGEALAVALAGRGANVVLAARDAQALERVKARCEAAGGKALAVPTDVGDPEACRRLVERTVEAFGGVDVLVNNAGITMHSRFEDVKDLGLYERLMRINYLGAVHCTFHALPHIQARKGLLVAVSSLTGKTGVPMRTGYAASKHAMQGFFDSLRIELLGTGTDVLVVSPGFVATDIRAHALGPEGQPLGQSPRDESGPTMDVDTCVALILRAMERREREVVMTLTGRVGLVLKLVAPALVDRLAARATRGKKA